MHPTMLLRILLVATTAMIALSCASSDDTGDPNATTTTAQSDRGDHGVPQPADPGQDEVGQSTTTASLPPGAAGEAVAALQATLPLTTPEADCVVAKIESDPALVASDVNTNGEPSQDLLRAATDCRTTVTYTQTLATDIATSIGATSDQTACLATELAKLTPDLIDQHILAGWTIDQEPPKELTAGRADLEATCGVDLSP